VQTTADPPTDRADDPRDVGGKRQAVEQDTLATRGQDLDPDHSVRRTDLPARGSAATISSMARMLVERVDASPVLDHHECAGGE